MSVKKSIRHLWKFEYRRDYFPNVRMQIAVMGETVYINDGVRDGQNKPHDDIWFSVDEAKELADILDQAIAIASGGIPKDSPYERYAPPDNA